MQKSFFSYRLGAILTLITLFLFSACTTEKKDMIGSGKVITEKRDMPEFDRIFFSGSGNLYIKQEENESIKIEAEDNIVSLLKTEVKEKTLHIYFENNSNIQSTQPINVYAKVKKLQEIHLSGSGTISSQHLNIQTLKVSISGSGNTDLAIFGNKIICILSGSGRFTLKGAVDQQDIWISGSGIYDAQDLTSKISNINVSGSGKVLVNVQDNLNLLISGAGIIYYKGNPKITQTISGSGRIHQIKENEKILELSETL